MWDDQEWNHMYVYVRSREGSATVRDSVESAHHEAYLCMWSLPLCNACNGMRTSIHGSDIMLTSCIWSVTRKQSLLTIHFAVSACACEWAVCADSKQCMGEWRCGTSAVCGGPSVISRDSCAEIYLLHRCTLGALHSLQPHLFGRLHWNTSLSNSLLCTLTVAQWFSQLAETNCPTHFYSFFLQPLSLSLSA